MNRPFSEEVLNVTLGAVRDRRRRRARAGRVALVSVFAVAIGVALIPKTDRDELATGAPVSEEPVPEKIVVPQRPTIVVFTTEQIAPKVERIDDAKLAELLGERRHGLVMMADGRRRLWVPES
jgi:hypothetical protein